MADIRVVEGVLRKWDPLGLAPGIESPADEYDSYAPHIVSLVRGGCTTDALADHLDSLCSGDLGLDTSTTSTREHSLRFAAKVVRALSLSNPSLERP
jgi:hypothetical protein